MRPEHDVHAEFALQVSLGTTEFNRAFGRFHGLLHAASEMHCLDGAAEVLGDYGAGPNHTLPTGGTARYSGGLSVFDFLRVRTWLAIDDPAAASPLVDDAIRLAGLEGLAAHERSAALRRPV